MTDILCALENGLCEQMGCICDRRKEEYMAVDKSLISGSTAMLILKLLSEKDMYGYEMIETLKERSNNVFELKAGTLYPLLHGLEDKGALKVYEKPVGAKVRKYYSITKQGRKALKEKEEDWRTYSQAVADVMGMLAFEGGIA